MKNKKILLVESNYADILAIQNSLRRLDGDHSLHVVHNIRDALQVLMGGSSQQTLENYSKTGKVRPDIVLLNISFLQESAREFLEVINKYYSLKNIRVFIIGDSQQQLDRDLADRYGIAGYLARPFDLHDTLNESVVSFRQELSRPGKALFAFPFIFLYRKFGTLFNIVKAKTAVVYAGQSLVSKVVLGTAATVMAAGIVSSSPELKVEEPGCIASKSASTIAAIPQMVTHSPASQEELAVNCLPPEVAIPVANEKPGPASHKRADEVADLAQFKTQGPVTRNYRIVAIEEPEPEGSVE